MYYVNYLGLFLNVNYDSELSILFKLLTVVLMCAMQSGCLQLYGIIQISTTKSLRHPLMALYTSSVPKPFIP